MKRYNPTEIEKKWQETWDRDGTYVVDLHDQTKPKYLGFSMLPGITGAGIHTGHGRTFQFSDIKVRAKRQQGYNAYHPIGWDSFGLPVENYAIKIGKKPRDAHDDAKVNFIRQLKRLGYSYDWTKQISTADPDYYKWTQWVFTQLYKNDLAYQKQSPQWWCEHDQTVLANEQVEGGNCWRCGNPVVKKNLKQWFFRITAYADEILEATDDLNWTEMVKTMQKNWIGKSQGAEVEFVIDQPHTNYIVLHGYSGTPDEAFVPWLKKSLERHEYTVDVPLLPDTKNPDIQAQADFVVENCHIDENTVIIGHSLGAAVALRVIETLKKPIKKFIPVAGFAQPGFYDRELPFEASTNWVFDFEKVRSNTKEIVLLRATNDSYVPGERIDFLQSHIGGTIIDFTAEKDHACGDKEPIILEAALEKIKVFTTRPDTLFGATFLVLAPEHELAKQLTNNDTRDKVIAYIDEAARKSEIERMNESRDKTGVFTGSHAINPATGEKIPIWIADYALASYGTGALMAVPAHDERDFAFAEKFKLPIVSVIERPESDSGTDMHHGEGVLTNSGHFDGMRSEEAREEVVAWLEEQQLGQSKITYKMRDWLISRQRYWGAPIPIVHVDGHGAMAVSDDQLPVVLPDVDDYTPKGGAVSVLAGVEDWVHVWFNIDTTETVPFSAGKPDGDNWHEGHRETDTMDGYACSSWYFLRYIDPFNDMQAWDPELAKQWQPVDFYNGGDHAVAHLLYSRFWMRFFYKQGLVPDPEPFKRMMYNGFILAPDGQKMSKSKGNVIDPLEIMDSGYGADSLRVYEMFIAPYDLDAPWDTRGVPGTYRFLNRAWTLVQEYLSADAIQLSDDAARQILAVAHKTTKKVTEDIEDDKFNTAVSAMMEAVNNYYKLKESFGIGKSDAWQTALEALLQVLAPFAPHITEELWADLGHTDSIHVDHWPKWDDSYLVSDVATIIVQVNGKLRAKLQVAKDATRQEVEQLALHEGNVSKFIGDKKPAKIIYVPGRLINIVIAG